MSIAAGVAVLVTTSTAMATVATIYADNFTGSASTALDGTSPGTDLTGATWNAPTAPSAGGWAANGSATTNNGAINVQAYLSFTPTSGNIYTLSATLDPTGGGGNWVGLGFSASDLNPLTSNGGPWMLLQGNGGIQFFTGPGTYDGTTAVGTYSLDQTAEIVLNTQQAQWTAHWYYDNTSLGSYTYSTNPNPTSITDVGVESIIPVQIGSFVLTTNAVPEPASLGLFAVGGMGLLLAARRRNTRV